MTRILICDDEAGLRSIIRRYAEFEGYHCDEAQDGLEAIEWTQKEVFDLIVMDIMMPGMDGYQAVKEIRRHQRVPIIMLSARTEEIDKILGFELGVDDYVTKPFSSKELMLRINAILRRVEQHQAEHEVFEKEGLLIDLTSYRLMVDGEEVSAPSKVLELLFFLVRNKNIAVSREKILSEVWGYDYFGDDRTLDTHMKLLRKALGQYAGWIVTLRGMGYRFDA